MMRAIQLVMKMMTRDDYEGINVRTTIKGDG